MFSMKWLTGAWAGQDNRKAGTTPAERGVDAPSGFPFPPEYAARVEDEIRNLATITRGAPNVPKERFEVAMNPRLPSVCGELGYDYTVTVDTHDAEYTLKGRLRLTGRETEAEIRKTVVAQAISAFRCSMKNEASRPDAAALTGPQTVQERPVSPKEPDTFYVTFGNSEHQKGALPTREVRLADVVDINRGRPEAKRMETITVKEGEAEKTYPLSWLAANFQPDADSYRTNLGAFLDKSMSVEELRTSIFLSIKKKNDGSMVGSEHARALENWPFPLSMFRWVSAQSDSWAKSNESRKGWYGGLLPFAMPSPHGYFSPVDVVSIQPSEAHSDDVYAGGSRYRVQLKDHADETAAYEDDRMRLFAVFVQEGGEVKWVEVPPGLSITPENMSAQLESLKGLPAFER